MMGFFLKVITSMNSLASSLYMLLSLSCKGMGLDMVLRMLVRISSSSRTNFTNLPRTWRKCLKLKEGGDVHSWLNSANLVSSSDKNSCSPLGPIVSAILRLKKE